MMNSNYSAAVQPLDLKQAYKVLRTHGFKRIHRGRGDNDCHVYEKVMDDRAVNVQLWPDGKHRVSHSHKSPYTDDVHAHTNTTPTSFTTIDQMHDALLHEQSRMDGIFASFNRKGRNGNRPHNPNTADYTG